jgi:hypothetical protein
MLKNKHKTDVTESVIPALEYKNDSVKLHAKMCNASIIAPDIVWFKL